MGEQMLGKDMTKDMALLVIDGQVGLINVVYRGLDVITRVADLIASARAAGAPVIYLQHDGESGSRLEIGSPGWYIHPVITPAHGDCVIRKPAPDAFYQTHLNDCLRTKGIRHVVIAGCRTEICIDTTSRRALSLDYDVTLVKDAHSTLDSNTLTAAQIISHHNETLGDFGTNSHAIQVKLSSEIHF